MEIGPRWQRLIKLDERLWPDCYYAKSDPSDVARVEIARSFALYPNIRRARQITGLTHSRCGINLKPFLLAACADAQCMCSHFPWVRSAAEMSQIGVQLTDSLYAVVNMRIMARIGHASFGRDRCNGEASRSMYSLRRVTSQSWGRRRFRGRAIPTKYIVHFPETREIWMLRLWLRRKRSTRARNALRCALPQTLLATKGGWQSTCLFWAWRALTAKRPTWPQRFRVLVERPNFAMLIPPVHFQEQGWKVWTVGGTYIAWIRPDADGRLRAINPESGSSGVAPGTSAKTQPERDEGAGAETPSSPTSP